MSQVRRAIAAALFDLAQKIDKKPRFETITRDLGPVHVVRIAQEVSRELKEVEWDVYGRPIRRH